MKKLILFFLLLICYEGFSQPLNYSNIRARYRWYSGMFDSALYVPRYNGTPSGVRVGENSAIDGAIAIDTANSRAYIYSGGAWIRVANYPELTSAYTFTNGLSQSGSTVKLGGALTENTTLGGNKEITFNQKRFYINADTTIWNGVFSGSEQSYTLNEVNSFGANTNLITVNRGGIGASLELSKKTTNTNVSLNLSSTYASGTNQSILFDSSGMKLKPIDGNLYIDSLDAGASTDSVLVWNASTGQVKKRDVSAVNTIPTNYINIIISGQSNAWGATGPNTWDTAANSRVLVWNHAQATPAWQTARINQRPFRTSGYNSLNGGALRDDLNGSSNTAFYLAKQLAEQHPLDTVRIIMAVADGTSITGWFNGTTRGQYTDSILVRGAASGITKTDLFIWHQGESDAGMAESTYNTAFDSLKYTLRRQSWFNPTTPMVLCGLLTSEQGGSSWQKDTTLIRYDADNDIWTSFAPSDSLDQWSGGENVHFSAGALDTLSQRVYGIFNHIGQKDRLTTFQSSGFRWDRRWLVNYGYPTMYAGTSSDAPTFENFFLLQDDLSSRTVFNLPTSSYSWDFRAQNGTTAITKLTGTNRLSLGFGISDNPDYAFRGRSTVFSPLTLYKLVGSLYTTDAQAADMGAGLGLGGRYDGTTASTEFAQIAGLKDNGTSGNFAGSLAGYYRINGGGFGEGFRLNVTGFGVWTNNPQKKFHTVGTVRMASLGTASTDSTTYKPLGIDTNGDVFPMASWAVGQSVTPTNTVKLENKRWKARVDSTTSSATPSINTDNVDVYKITAQAADITSMTTNLSGTPDDMDILEITITGTASRAITWGASFVSTTVTLPATTSSTNTLTVILQYYKSSSYGNNKWHCVNYY